jgi:hypothetical protein
MIQRFTYILFFNLLLTVSILAQNTKPVNTIPVKSPTNTTLKQPEFKYNVKVDDTLGAWNLFINHIIGTTNTTYPLVLDNGMVKYSTLN